MDACAADDDVDDHDGDDDGGKDDDNDDSDDEITERARVGEVGARRKEATKGRIRGKGRPKQR